MRLVAAFVAISFASAVPVRARAAKKAPPAPAYVQQIRATVDAHLEELADCVDTNKLKKGTPDVHVDVQVMILSDGAILSAKRSAKGKKADAGVEKCMLDKVRKWRFPPPPDHQTVAVDFPIVLQLVGPDGKR